MIAEFSLTLSVFLFILVLYFGNISCTSTLSTLSRFEENSVVENPISLRTENDNNSDNSDEDEDYSHVLDFDLESVTTPSEHNEHGEHSEDENLYNDITNAEGILDLTIDFKTKGKEISENEVVDNDKNIIKLNVGPNKPQLLIKYQAEEPLAYVNDLVAMLPEGIHLSEELLKSNVFKFTGLQYIDGKYYPIVYVDAARIESKKFKWNQFAGTLLYYIRFLQLTTVKNEPIGYESGEPPQELNKAVLVFDTKACKSLTLPYKNKITKLKEFFLQHIPKNSIVRVYVVDGGLLGKFVSTLNRLFGSQQQFAQQCKHYIAGTKIESPVTVLGNTAHHLIIECN